MEIILTDDIEHCIGNHKYMKQDQMEIKGNKGFKVFKVLKVENYLDIGNKGKKG